MKLKLGCIYRLNVRLAKIKIYRYEDKLTIGENFLFAKDYFE